MPRLSTFVTHRPITSALVFAALDTVLATGGAVAITQAFPDLGTMPQRFVTFISLSLVLAVLLTALRWWRRARFNGPSAWRDLRVVVLPLVVSLVPLLGGVRPLATDELALLVAGYLLTGFYEEGFFRGLVLPLLLPRLGIARGVALTSALFGLAHLSNVLYGQASWLTAAQAFGAACGGVGFAALWLRTGSIWPVLAIHALADFTLQVTGVTGGAKIALLVGHEVVLFGYGLYLLRRGATRANLTQPSGEPHGGDDLLTDNHPGRQAGTLTGSNA